LLHPVICREPGNKAVLTLAVFLDLMKSMVSGSEPLDAGRPDIGAAALRPVGKVKMGMIYRWLRMVNNGI
jgi:hypothetical protein